MRILFWGTPTFAVSSLRALTGEGHEIVGVVTQPDRPAGRGRRLRSSSTKEVATAEAIPVLEPGKPRGEGFLEEIRDLAPDLSVVVAYGHILGRDVLDMPPLGSINVHASLLPELRGAAPINWAIMRGYRTTGVTIMRMTEGMDAGPILYQVDEPILEDETASQLHDRLAEVGAAALVMAVNLLENGMAEETEQDHARATYAPKIDRESARIDWTSGAREVSNHIRGLDAVPGAWSTLEGQDLKLFRPGSEPGEDTEAEPGTIVSDEPDEGLLVATGEGTVVIREVQPPGRRRMPAADWLRGRGARAGQRFA